MGADVPAAPALVSTRVGTLGALAAGAFLVAFASGAILAVPYDPADAYGSLAALLLANPAGVFFRNVHYWSGQACLVLTVAHAWDHLRTGGERRVTRGVWARLVASFAILGFILLSGFLLRGDADAQQALRIVTEIASQLPLAGEAISTLVFGAPGSLQLVYVQHAASATLVTWLVVAEHSRRAWPRTAAFAAVLAAVSLLSLVVAPGLHDGRDPVVKGPWFFLGVQEMLHWTPWPVAVVTAASAALLAAVYAVRVAGARGASRLKAALAAVVVAYVGACALAAVARGESWSWSPGGPSGPGNPRIAWLLATAAPAPETLPTAAGRPEGCLVCHRDVEGLGNAHRPSAVGCASCHGGNPLTLVKSGAHDGIDPIPGNLATARLQCGGSACHAPIVARVERSLMATMSGVIAVDRAVFGEPSPAHARVSDLGHSAADTHLRQGCASCHLGREKTALGPNGEDARGGGCSACHLTYDAPALAALRAYESAKAAGAAAPPARHPALSLDIGNAQCFGCHSRSGRISTSYEGWHETSEPPPGADDPRRPLAPGHRRLADGRVFERRSADVHHERGLDCIDCHGASETMGDGRVHAAKREQVRVACEDCHARPGATPASVRREQLDPESLRLLAIRAWPAGASDRYVRGRSGDALVNVVVDASGEPHLVRKRTGERRPLKPMSKVCAEGGGHSRLSCQSCHAAWAPRCPECHTSFDAKAERFDWVANADTRGSWEERAGAFFANPPTLGVVRRGAAESIDPFVPGMIITLDRARDAGAAPDVVLRRLYARIDPHTTRTQARACESCHADPEALGYGRGRLSFEPTSPGAGRWTFSPAAAALPQDGLPSDAWIPFLGSRTGMVSTRPDARPFDVDEQRRILTVGACLTCHRGDSKVMRLAVEDFGKTIDRLGPTCRVPDWSASARRSVRGRGP